MPSADPLAGLSDLISTPGPDDNPFQSELRLIHIRVYQRKSRKYVTTIEGMPDDLKLKNVVKYMKKNFSCSGVIKKGTKNDIETSIIQLSGDQRNNIEAFLIKQKIAEKRQIKIHGF